MLDEKDIGERSKTEHGVEALQRRWRWTKRKKSKLLSASPALALFCYGARINFCLLLFCWKKQGLVTKALSWVVSNPFWFMNLKGFDRTHSSRLFLYISSVAYISGPNWTIWACLGDFLCLLFYSCSCYAMLFAAVRTENALYHYRLGAKDASGYHWAWRCYLRLDETAQIISAYTWSCQSSYIREGGSWLGVLSSVPSVSRSVVLMSVWCKLRLAQNGSSYATAQILKGYQ